MRGILCWSAACRIGVPWARLPDQQLHKSIQIVFAAVVVEGSGRSESGCIEIMGAQSSGGLWHDAAARLLDRTIDLRSQPYIPYFSIARH